MRDFTILIYDVRYDVPTVRLVQSDDEGKIADLAVSIFRESMNHTAVEVWNDSDRRILHIGQRTAPAPLTLAEATKLKPPPRSFP